MEHSDDRTPDKKQTIEVPMQRELEGRFLAKVITFDDRGVTRPGGMCGCCGSGPNITPDWRGEPWYVYQAGICDEDGMYFSMLCEDCLEDIRASNTKRMKTERDEVAETITDLLGDDLDGAQTFMDDIA